jgi:hypothetical protein
MTTIELARRWHADAMTTATHYREVASRRAGHPTWEGGARERAAMALSEAARYRRLFARAKKGGY